MKKFTDRTELLIGESGVLKLKNSAVLVVGAGGVGSAALEGLARAGVGSIGICEFDTVDITNVNRQLLANVKNVDSPKIQAAKNRILEINPMVKLELYPFFYDAKNDIDLSKYDYVIDAIDCVTSKLLLIERAISSGTRIVSSMGTGNKLDPSLLQIADIKKTSVCPLARVMRRELKSRGINKLNVVFSTEEPIKIQRQNGVKAGSVAFVPSVAGLMLAGFVFRELLEEN